MPDEKRREERAKRLLNDELFNESFDILRTDLIERWHNSSSNESEARESIWLAIRLLEKVRGHVVSIVETGHMNKILDKQHPFI